jgi:outer membrane protein
MKPLLFTLLTVSLLPAQPLVELGLSEAVRSALARHPEVALERQSQQQAGRDVNAARAAFDPVWKTQLSLEDNQTPTSSVLEGPNGRLRLRNWSHTHTLSQLLPWQGIRWEAGWTQIRSSTNNPFFSLNPFNRSSLLGNLRIPLLQGRRRDEFRTELHLRRKQAELAATEVEARLIALAARTESAYFDLLAAQQNLAAAERLALTAERAEQATTRLIEAGQLPAADRSGAAAKVAESRDAALAAQGRLRLAEESLKELIAQDLLDPLWRARFKIQPPPLTLPPEAEDTLARQALTRRLELRAMAPRKDIANAQLALANDLKKPRLDLTGSLTAQGLAGRDVPQDQSFFPIPPLPRSFIGGSGAAASQAARLVYPTWQVGLQWELPIGNRAAESRAGRAAVEVARVETERTRLERLVWRDVRQALALAQNTAARVEEAERAAHFAAERLESELRLLEGGKSNNLNVNSRQAEVAGAEQRLIAVRREQWQAATDLRRAVGETLEAHSVRLD